MKNHPYSSANWTENNATTPLGWLHMPAFGSGYREFAASSLPLDLKLTPALGKEAQTLPLSSFWSTVSHTSPRPAAALC